uniref:Uncharacterized protein n=1 Tax=Plectus sambesii TaxID=2011161 RepID=A0A914W9Z5_9BILA
MKKPKITSLSVNSAITLSDDERRETFQRLNAYENMALTDVQLIHRNVFADEANVSDWFREQLELLPKNKTTLTSISLRPGVVSDAAYDLVQNMSSADGSASKEEANLSIYFEDAPLSQALCTDSDEEMMIRSDLLFTAVPTAIDIYYRQSKQKNIAVINTIGDDDDEDKDATMCYLAFLTIISDYCLRRKTIHIMQRIFSGVRLAESDVIAMKIGKFVQIGIDEADRAEMVARAVLDECSLLTVLSVNGFPFNLDIFWMVDDTELFDVLKRKASERCHIWEVSFQEISQSSFRIREGRGTAWFDLITVNGSITVDRMRSVVREARVPQ